ncbi:fungal specific transcription factor [Colletotrichum orchidophilum]|uniref:Fungal specific transcription factor n=1 Tax=Colletotrichum orchidophilum TaxID=1209926 RepID=A0A1G4BNJ3_9PEZI|nr:fungal specific transcription factor [Colletotrichum orchidophilum]OHF02856.1 fungal specific transcription factor [Colletotrichum orchidophilum]
MLVVPAKYAVSPFNGSYRPCHSAPPIGHHCLHAVVRLLEDLELQFSLLPASSTATPGGPPAVTQLKTVASSSILTSASHANSAQTTDHLVECESLLTAQSIFAHDFLRKTVGDGSSVLKMRETLKQQPASHELTYLQAKPMARPAFGDCEMPLHPGPGMGDDVPPPGPLHGPGPQVYFAPTEFNEAEFIIVNAGMESLYADKMQSKTVIEQLREKCSKMGTLYRGDLQTALANLPLHLPTTMDKHLTALGFPPASGQQQ